MKKLTEGAHQTSNDLTVVCFILSYYFTMVFSVNHAHYLLGVDNKIDELSRWKNSVLIEIEDVASKKLGFQIF